MTTPTELDTLQDLAMDAEDLQLRLMDVVEEVAEFQRRLERYPETAHVAASMRAYLVSHLQMAVSNDSEWMGSNPCTMQSVVDFLKDESWRDDEDQS